MPNERSIETGIEIDAPVEAVWKALTDATELTNWFPPEARVKPGVGGSIWVRWDEHAQFDTPIAAWKPNQHLKLIYCEPVTGDQVPPGGFEIPFQVAVDYHLAARRGGGTVLRLVQSGFPSDASWDAQYDGTVRGWDFQLCGLKHFLERHRGTPRAVVKARATFDNLPLEEPWQRLMGQRGLLARGSLEGLAPGDRYALTTSGGDRLEGRVQVHQPPRDFAATVENHNDALLRLWIDPPCFTAPRATAYLWLSTFGLPAATVRGLQERFDSLFAELFAPVGA